MRWKTVALLALAYALAWSGYLFSASGPSSSPASQGIGGGAADATPASMPASAKTQPASRAAITVESVFTVAGVDPGPMRDAHPGGYVDWKRCQVVADGTGKAKSRNASDIAMAGRAARLVAARNAVLLLKGIKILPDGTVPGLRNGQIDVDALLENFQELSSEFNPKDMTMRVTLAWQLPRDGCQLSGLVHLTLSSDPAVRRVSIQALGDLGDVRAVSAIKACHDDADESVRQAVQVSLRQLHAE